MKTLNNFILEKLKVSSKSKISTYNYQPKDKNELKSIVKELIKERGTNCNLSDINTSNITDMSDLFRDNEFNDFNPDVSGWNVEKVTNMSNMFTNCIKFEGKGLETWDVSNVKNIDSMFYNLSTSGKNDVFNPDLSNWDLSKCESIREMFKGCVAFEGKGLENWDLSNLTKFGLVMTFDNCYKFNADVSNWNININLAKFMGTFNNCYEFEGKGLDKWDVSNADTFVNMFNGCKKLNVDLNIWETAFDPFMDKKTNLPKKSKLRLLKNNTENMFKNCETLEKNNLLPDWYKKIWDI